MAIQWKYTYNYQSSIPGTPPGGGAPPAHGNAFGAPVIICDKSDNMASIKSISICNGNNVDFVYCDVWIDTSPLYDATANADQSPEYSAYKTFIIQNIKVQPMSTITYPIDYATWSSNGCFLKMRLTSSNLQRVHAVSNVAPYSNGTTGPGGWMQGSVMISGNNDKNYDFKID